MRQATDWRSLAALTAGGMAYRAGRIGFQVPSSKFQVLGFFPSRFLSIGAGLAAEVSAFEGTHRALHPESPNLWRWSGPAGLKQGLLQSLVTFSALKTAGYAARGENLIVSHLFQDSAMVLGHQASAALGVVARPSGSLAEQFLHAEATTLQVGAGLALSHRFAPGIAALERGLDLSLLTTNGGAQFPRPRLGSGTGEETSPLQIQNVMRPTLALAAEGPSFRPIEILAMVKNGDEGGDGPKQPSTPREVGSPEGLDAVRDQLFERFAGARDDFARQERWMLAYLTIGFQRYADLVTQWAFQRRNHPAPLSDKNRRNLQKPLARILNLVTAFAVSEREMERIQFDFRRWGIELNDPIKNTYSIFRESHGYFSELGKLLENKLIPVFDEPRLTVERYSEIMEILDQLRDKNPAWVVPVLPHPSFLPAQTLTLVKGAGPETAVGDRVAEGAPDKIISIAERRKSASHPEENDLPPLSPEHRQAFLSSIQSEWGIDKSAAEFGLQRIITQYVGVINHWLITERDEPLSLPPERLQELENLISDEVTTLDFIDTGLKKLEMLRRTYHLAKVKSPDELEALRKALVEAQTKYRKSVDTFQKRLMGLLKNPSLSYEQFMTYRSLVIHISTEHGWDPPVYMIGY